MYLQGSWRKEPFDDPEWVFDFKYDGFRGLCYIKQGRCRFISRNCNVLNRFDALGDQVTPVLHVDDAILDGEVIAADKTGRPQFYDLIRRTRTPTYVAFDILWLGTVPTCDLCRSASAESGCKRFCRRSQRSSPRGYPSQAEAASSSN
jgi:ATP-dependent DNA ligase